MRIGYTHHGPDLDVHARRCRDPPNSCRGIRCSISGICSAPLGIGRRADPARERCEMRDDADAAAARSSGVLRRRRHRAGRTAGGPACQRGQSVPPLAAGVTSPRWSSQLARRDPARRFVVTSGPSDAGRRARGRPSAPQRARRRCGASRSSHGTFDAGRAARARPRARRCTLGATAVRCTSRRPRGRRSWRCSGHAPGTVDAVARSAVVRGGGGRRSAALPAVPPAHVRAGRLPLPDAHRRRAGRGRRRTSAARPRRHEPLERR